MIVAVLAILSASVGPANAAASRTVSLDGTGVTLLEPTPAQRTEALIRLEQARLQDPTGFSQRVKLIQSSKPLKKYLSADRRFDARQQQEFLAASMPTDALESLVSLTDSGYLTLQLTDGPKNTKVAKLVKAKPVMVGGGKGSTAMMPMYPQCPSAWAALWAWWGTNMAFCGAMGFFGPMAMIGCSAAMTIAGGFIDFNRGC
ncbi:hypothetical protein J3A64_004444 [Pseudarthrobacter sp. PvP004]|uniref:hypothetical protein n=1 Tax=Pseudarthrobacter sp. PvP004 TaxID=2817850 RepID=UPI001AE44835|nr:hypothetical protein [Pseudarthrobacter sp. PvP004]MBP2268980.1 hypothetical protein [Pseudarthrobacter sp. PvP004]